MIKSNLTQNALNLVSKKDLNVAYVYRVYGLYLYKVAKSLRDYNVLCCLYDGMKNESFPIL